MAFVRYYVGDVVKMKKSHPCGSDEWEVKRIGTDFLIVCNGCGHQLLMPRPKFEKAVKKIVSRLPEMSKEELWYDLLIMLQVEAVRVRLGLIY